MKDYDLAVQETARQLGMTVGEVRMIYDGFWQFIKDKIESIPMTERLLTKEEFDKYDTVFNAPSLCKVYSTYDIYVKKMKQIEKRKEHAKHKESASDVQRDTGDEGQV